MQPAQKKSETSGKRKHPSIIERCATGSSGCLSTNGLSFRRRRLGIMSGLEPTTDADGDRAGRLYGVRGEDGTAGSGRDAR
jgi:hypothetical protein